MKMIFRISCVFFGLFIATSAQAGPDMKVGKWQMTTKMEMEGMPFEMPPVVFTQCLTKDDMVPNNSGANQQNCKMIDSKESKNTITWHMQCPDSNIKGEITYKGTTMQGVMHIESQNGPMMKSVLSGKHIGKCD